MAAPTYWIGGRGPYEYDDTAEYVPVDTSEFVETEFVDPLDPYYVPGEPYMPVDTVKVRPFRTNGVILQEAAPDSGNGSDVVNVDYAALVLRLVTVGNLDSPDLSAQAGSGRGSLIIVTDADPGIDAHTLYAWDPDYAGPTPDGVFIVDGADGGVWVAVSGKYQYGTTLLSGDLAGRRLITSTSPVQALAEGDVSTTFDLSSLVYGVIIFEAPASSRLVGTPIFSNGTNGQKLTLVNKSATAYVRILGNASGTGISRPISLEPGGAISLTYLNATSLWHPHSI